MGRHENNWNTTPQVPKGQYMDMGKGKASKQLHVSMKMQKEIEVGL